MMDKVKTVNTIGFSVFQIALTKVHELFVRYCDSVTCAQFAQCFRAALYALDGQLEKVPYGCEDLFVDITVLRKQKPFISLSLEDEKFILNVYIDYLNYSYDGFV